MDRDSQYSSSQKTKRMRTSFKHHQLRTMKSYFAINHNPDAKDLKQLAQKTGLTKRVLQVIRAADTLSCTQGRRRQMPTGMKEFHLFPVQISLLPSVNYMKWGFPERSQISCFILRYCCFSFHWNSWKTFRKLQTSWAESERDFLSFFLSFYLFIYFHFNLSQIKKQGVYTKA